MFVALATTGGRPTATRMGKLSNDATPTVDVRTPAPKPAATTASCSTPVTGLFEPMPSLPVSTQDQARRGLAVCHHATLSSSKRRCSGNRSPGTIQRAFPHDRFGGSEASAVGASRRLKLRGSRAGPLCLRVRYGIDARPSSVVATNRWGQTHRCDEPMVDKHD